jgi:hypothetical protein
VLIFLIFLVRTGNPFRESGPPANMAKLILLRHKVLRFNHTFTAEIDDISADPDNQPEATKLFTYAPYISNQPSPSQGFMDSVREIVRWKTTLLISMMLDYYHSVIIQSVNIPLALFRLQSCTTIILLDVHNTLTFSYTF